MCWLPPIWYWKQSTDCLAAVAVRSWLLTFRCLPPTTASVRLAARLKVKVSCLSWANNRLERLETEDWKHKTEDWSDLPRLGSRNMENSWVCVRGATIQQIGWLCGSVYLCLAPPPPPTCPSKCNCRHSEWVHFERIAQPTCGPHVHSKTLLRLWLS